MKVKDIMKENPITLKLKDRLDDLFEVLKKYDIGCVIVVDEEKKPFQIITLRDLPKICYFNLQSEFIKDILKNLNKDKNSLITIYSNSSVFEALAKMKSFQISHLPVVDKNNKLRGILSIRDIAKKFSIFLYLDPLTQTYNRKYLDLLKYRLNKVNSPVCFLMIDIDNFKKINDTFGHLQGDKVLQKLAELLKNNIKVTDEIIRYGGEEFLIIAYRCDLEGAEKLGERLREKVENMIIDEVPGIKLTVSIGISLYKRDKDIVEIIEQADRAMYTAKRLGKNRVCICSE